MDGRLPQRPAPEQEQRAWLKERLALVPAELRLQQEAGQGSLHQARHSTPRQKTRHIAG